MIGGPVAAGAHEWRTADLSAALRGQKGEGSCEERAVARGKNGWLRKEKCWMKEWLLNRDIFQINFEKV
jgi:hypothetical protein